MSLNTAEANLMEIRRRLALRRRELNGQWKDEMALKFSGEVLDPLDRDLQKAIEAMAEIAPLLAKAKRECE